MALQRSIAVLLLALVMEPALAQTNPQELSVEQQGRLRAAITAAQSGPIVDVDFAVTPGAQVPDHVSLQPLPAEITEIAPELAGQSFFLLPDGRIAVVAPQSREIIRVFSL
jgi:hypothetical protein